MNTHDGVNQRKREVAMAALDLLPEAGVLDLGTGSTTRFFIEAVGELVRAGRQFVGVPTSRATRRLAEQVGIPLLEDEGPWQIDVCVDGADEVSRELDKRPRQERAGMIGQFDFTAAFRERIRRLDRRCRTC